jgi:hypothetical protein
VDVFGFDALSLESGIIEAILQMEVNILDQRMVDIGTKWSRILKQFQIPGSV